MRSHRQSDYTPSGGGNKHCMLENKPGRPPAPHRAESGMNKAANARAIPNRSRRSRSDREPRSMRVSSLPGIRFQSARPAPKAKTHRRNAMQTSMPAGVTDDSMIRTTAASPAIMRSTLLNRITGIQCCETFLLIATCRHYQAPRSPLGSPRQAASGVAYHLGVR
jgi:hypothetical protein